ncbi:MAG: dynamin family protein [Elainellaceae cyanobacterium]
MALKTLSCIATDRLSFRELFYFSDILLAKALEELVQGLQNPVLTLATAGTTSSGKSTLVNLLCGAEIVPVAVSEMSAGAVTIEYSHERSLVITETPGALWECGEWRGISEDEICRRLNQAMRSYIDNHLEPEHRGLACPNAVIGYPFRLIRKSTLDLPAGTKVRIMDLPGLAYVGDEGNANVIRQCREALCLVTYNSAETDSQKVRSLLQEVVEQVKDLGGSPARMLFVLNRIDEFRADRDWPDTEHRFVAKTIERIKQELTEQLKEYTEEIEALQVVKLSSWPALLSLQIRSTDDIYSVDACKRADNHFNVLVEDILEDLPRKTERWSIHDRNRVANALWERSYAETFQQNLIAHIDQHFPQLVIPQLLDHFKETAGNAMAEWAIQTTNTRLKSAEDEYEQECERIQKIRQDISQFLEDSAEELDNPFKRATQTTDSDPTTSRARLLDRVVSDFRETPPYNELGDKLTPLYDWQRALKQAINQVFEAVADSLVKGKLQLDSTYLRKHADEMHIQLLQANLRRLVDCGYTGSAAKNGEVREAKTELEQKQLKQLNEELNLLSQHLSLVMQDVVEAVFQQERSRIEGALDVLFEFQVSHLEDGCNQRAENLAITLTRPQKGRNQAPQIVRNQAGDRPELRFRFKAGFDITPGTWNEPVQTAYKERAWWTLWLLKETKYRAEYRERSSSNATIPSVEDLITNWTEQQSKELDNDTVKGITDWLLDQIAALKKSVDEEQRKIVDRYQERLDQARLETEATHEQLRMIWLPLCEKAGNLKEYYTEFSQVLK